MNRESVIKFPPVIRYTAIILFIIHQSMIALINYPFLDKLRKMPNRGQKLA